MWRAPFLLFLLVLFALSACQVVPEGGSSEGGGAPVFPLYSARPDGVYEDGVRIPLYGVNWFGLETCDRAPHGLWSGRSVADILAQVRSWGFTALRVPVSSQVLRDEGTVASWAQVGDPAYPSRPFEGLRYFLEKAEGFGFHVLLDFHTFRCDLIGGNLPGRPFDPSRGYTKEDWFQDLRRMARLSLEFPNVFGIDLVNEPYNLAWSEWRALAQEGAAQVLAVNPRVLVAVEGVANLSNNGGYQAFWGENLAEATDDLGLGERLLYLPHVYGPDVYDQPYFSDPSFPENMAAIWDAHFGHLSERGLPWGVGEFGGHYQGQDRVWQDAFVDYLRAKGVGVWFYWALNPNSGDTGGLLQDDWRTPVSEKLDLLKRLMPVSSSGLSFDFLEALGEVPNPERGFAGDSYYPDEPSLDASAKVAEARARGFEIRLIRRTYYLHAYAGQDTLPPAFLDTLAQDLSSAQAAGVKLILRFAYRPGENPPGGPVYCDPSEDRILAHLSQIGPVLRAHKGAIAYLEAGLIGPWGEWHSASPGVGLMDPLPGYSDAGQPPCGERNYDRKLPNLRTLNLVRALLNEVPGRLVAVRYPMAKAKLLELEAGGPSGTYPAASSFTPLTEAEAHGESLKARLGAHNDCFLASPNDYGTYYYDPGPQQDLEKAYWSEDSRYTVMGGETCTPEPYVPSGQDPATYVYGAFQRFRFNNLNINYHPDFLAWLASTRYGSGTLLEALKRDLGYRLHLRRVEIDRGQVPAGGSLGLRLYLANRGFGGLYNPKVLSLVFLREDGARVERTLSPAFYGPPPGEEAAYAYTVRAPESPGRYRLYLKLSDPDLPEDVRYNVQLATRTAYVDGMNDLVLYLEVR